MSNEAGWEVEGFIERLTRRNGDNDERLVLEAISHLRAFSNQDTVLRNRITRQNAENERLRAVLRNVRGYIKHCDHEPALDEIDAALRDPEQRGSDDAK